MEKIKKAGKGVVDAGAKQMLKVRVLRVHPMLVFISPTTCRHHFWQSTRNKMTSISFFLHGFYLVFRLLAISHRKNSLSPKFCSRYVFWSFSME
jgi:hypothetical protein